MKLTDSPGAVQPAIAEATHHPITWRLRAINLIVVLLPFAGLVAAIIMLWGVAFSWVYLALLVGMYLATGLGITVGFHRFFTHKSFDAPKPVVFMLGALGSMAIQGSILEWVSVHRSHHQHSDEADDPHSPHTHGDTVLGILRGAWHSHIGWLFAPSPKGLDRYVVDLKKDKMINWISKTFPFWALFGLALPALLGGLLTMSWMGVLLGLIWGGLVRVFFVHHVTWSVNSVCHIWGSRPYRSHDESRNNAIIGILAMGEGWHNNHHAFPTSARHGLSWWQFDLSYVLIKSLSLIGLASNVRVPAPERLAAKRA